MDESWTLAVPNLLVMQDGRLDRTMYTAIYVKHWNSIAIYTLTFIMVMHIPVAMHTPKDPTTP